MITVFTQSARMGWVPMSMGNQVAALSAFTRRFREITAGMKQEDVGRKLGYSSGRIGQIQRGEKPGREFVERLIAAFELPREEWLELSGYGNLPDPGVDETMVRSVEEAMRRMGLASKSGSEALISGIADLQQELGRPILISFDHSIRSGLTVEQADEMLAHIRKQAEAGVF
jgi:transcriptional regulator with XRE-family HTH domain